MRGMQVGQLKGKQMDARQAMRCTAEILPAAGPSPPFPPAQVLTPAISVVSAVEGIQFKTGMSTTVVVVIAVAILVALFAMQSFGTERVSVIFRRVCAWGAALIGARAQLQGCGTSRQAQPCMPTPSSLHLQPPRAHLVPRERRARCADTLRLGRRKRRGQCRPRLAVETCLKLLASQHGLSPCPAGLYNLSKYGFGAMQALSPHYMYYYWAVRRLSCFTLHRRRCTLLVDFELTS